MGLEVVLNQIQTAGQQEESNILEQAQFEKERILADAQKRIDELRQQGQTRTEARLDALRRELLSAAEFESRRRLLVARRELAEDFRKRVHDAVAALPAAKNTALLTKLGQKAAGELPKGTVNAKRNDLPALVKAGFKSGRETSGLGGFQVESADGSVLLDYTYETLLDNAWKQILSEHQTLFEA
jgi:vacuolar-type H+-ATPase subunit E/Vma4